MSNCCSIKEIEVKYQGEWVFLVKCERTEKGELKSGRVILHSPNRDEIYRNLAKLKSRKGITAIKYFGKIPEDLTVMLWV